MDLEYTIKTVAELSGAEAVARALEVQIGKAKALGEDYSELAKKLDRVNASIAQSKSANTELADSMGVVSVSQEDVNKALGKTEEAAGASHRQMRLLASALGSDVPGGAAVLESAFEAMEGSEGAAMASTFLLVAGLEMLRAAIEKISEEQKTSQKIADEFYTDKPSEVIEKQREAFEHAEVAEENYHHNLLRNTRDSIAKTAELATALLNARKSAFEGEEDTRKGIADTEVEAMEQRGVVSHETAVKMKEQIDLAYHQRKVAMMIAEDQLEVQILANQYNAKSVGLRRDEAEESAAADKYKTAVGARTANDTKLAEAREKTANAEKAKDELRETGVTEDNVQQLRDMFTKMTGKDAGTTSLEDQFHELANRDPGANAFVRHLFGPSGDRNLATYEGAEIDIAGNKKLIKQLQGRQPGLEITEGDTKSDLDASRTKLQKDRQDVQDLQDKISTQRQTNAIKEGGAIQDLGLDKASSALSADRGIADQVSSGAKVSDADSKKLIADASRIAGYQVDLQTAAQIIEHGANNMSAFMLQLNRLATAMGHLNPGEIDQLKQRVDAVERIANRAGYAADYH